LYFYFIFDKTIKTLLAVSLLSGLSYSSVIFVLRYLSNLHLL